MEAEGSQREELRQRVKTSPPEAQDVQQGEETKDKNVEKAENLVTFQWIVKVVVGCLITVTIGMMYAVYLSTFHERKFWLSSHTDVDREITFQGDGAIYYSFYKDLLRAPSLERGIIELAYNNKTVPLKTINAVRQLALYPEVTASAMLQMVGKQGVDPVYFYLGMVFGLQAIYLGALFVTSWLMSGTWLAGMLAAAWFIINRTDTTRIEDSVPLRENWALPYFACQVAALTVFLKNNGSLSVERFCFMIMCACTYIFMLMWEYSHYLLFVQALSLCLLDGLSLVNKEKVQESRKMYLAAVSLGYLLQFQNSTLLTSPLLCLVLGSMIARGFQTSVRMGTIQARVWKMIMYFCLTFTLSVSLHLLIGALVTRKENNQILKSLEVKFGLKITNNFTVNWLLCHESFQPPSQDCIFRLTQSSLLPFYILVLIVCLVSLYQGLRKSSRGNPGDGNITPEEGQVGERPEVLYHVVQSLILGLLAMNFERLKYLWTPYVCVIAAFGVCSPALWLTVFKWLRLRTVNPVKLAVVLSVAVPAVIGFSLWREFLPRIVGELSELEEHYESDTSEVMNWIKSQAPPTAVIAASPQLMGAIKLCTGSMVTSLPIYNDEELMRRNEDMYQIYSMRAPEEIYKILTSYRASYMVIEESLCNEAFRMDNCRVKDLLDIANGHVLTGKGHDYSYSKYGRFCQEIKLNHSPHVNYFRRVYWNRSYFIYKINTVISFQA